MSVPVQDNYLAIYPFYCFGSLNLRIKCKRIFDSCVSLFSYQGSCRSCDSHIRLSHLFELVKNFFYFFETFFLSYFRSFLSFATASLDYHIWAGLSRPFWSFFNFFFDSFAVSGERGIWTLARRKPSTPLAGAPLQPLEYFCTMPEFLSYPVVYTCFRKCNIDYIRAFFICQRLIFVIFALFFGMKNVYFYILWCFVLFELLKHRIWYLYRKLFF